MAVTLRKGPLRLQVVLTPDPAGAPIYVTSNATGPATGAVTAYDLTTGLAPSAVLYDGVNKPLLIPAR